jgi:hypothetical protein
VDLPFLPSSWLLFKQAQRIDPDHLKLGQMDRPKNSYGAKNPRQVPRSNGVNVGDFVFVPKVNHLAIVWYDPGIRQRIHPDSAVHDLVVGSRRFSAQVSELAA